MIGDPIVVDHELGEVVLAVALASCADQRISEFGIMV